MTEPRCEIFRPGRGSGNGQNDVIALGEPGGHGLLQLLELVRHDVRQRALRAAFCYHRSENLSIHFQNDARLKRALNIFRTQDFIARWYDQDARFSKDFQGMDAGCQKRSWSYGVCDDMPAAGFSFDNILAVCDVLPRVTDSRITHRSFSISTFSIMTTACRRRRAADSLY